MDEPLEDYTDSDFDFNYQEYEDIQEQNNQQPKKTVTFGTIEITTLNQMATQTQSESGTQQSAPEMT